MWGYPLGQVRLVRAVLGAVGLGAAALVGGAATGDATPGSAPPVLAVYYGWLSAGCPSTLPRCIPALVGAHKAEAPGGSRHTVG